MAKLEVITVFDTISIRLDEGKSGRLELTIVQARELAEELYTAADIAEEFRDDDVDED